VRKKVDRIDEYYTLPTKNGQNVLIKAIIITQGNTSRSVHKAMRNTLRELIEQTVRKSSFEELMERIMKYSLQNDIKKKLSKIYPVRDISFRHVRLLDKSVTRKESTNKALAGNGKASERPEGGTTGRERAGGDGRDARSNSCSGS
jgi:ribosomal protein S3AE